MLQFFTALHMKRNPKIRRYVGALTLAAVAILTAAVPAIAQNERPVLKIDRFEPDTLELDAGSEAFVLLYGTALDELTEARIIIGGNDAVGIVGTLATAEGAGITSRVLRLTSAADAAPGRYRIQLRAGRGIVATMARMDLIVVEPDLTPSIVEALFDERVIENVPLRVRVRTSCPAGLAQVRATIDKLVVEAQPLPADPTVAELELPALGAGQRTVELVAIDVDGRRSEPLRRSIDIASVVADLRISGISLKPPVAHAGQSVGAFVAVANSGTAPAVFAPGAVLLTWNIDAGENREFTVGRETLIAPGLEHVFGPLIFEVEQAGSHPISVSVDPIGLIEESNESNNSVVQQVVVGPRRHPDLTIVGVEFDPPTPSFGSSFRAQVRVMNQGSGDAAIFPPDRILAADGFHELRAGPQAMILGPSQTTQFEVSVQPEHVTTGEQRWIFNVDPDNHVAESVEDNNSFIATATLATTGTALPDLVVDTATPRPADPAVAGAVFLVLGIRNIGTVEAVFPAGHRFYEIDGPMGAVIPIITQTPQRIAPGKTLGMRTVDFAFETSGSHKLTISLDPEEVVAESDESNNLSWVTIDVK